jgi:hypothetical protein
MPPSAQSNPHRDDATVQRSGSAHVFAALALELAPGTHAERSALPQHAAGALAMQVASDLARLQPQAAELQLALCAAHYDPTELLRPQWPLHAALVRLAANAPGADASRRVIAFGRHDGRLPDALSPSPEQLGGPLRLLPIVLSGDRAIVEVVEDAFERDLLERGMAGAATALFAQDAFGMRIEHARYLTLHDVLAMTALQYEHAGLDVLWPVIEMALLTPAGQTQLDAAPEPLVQYADGEAHIALFSPDTWRGRYASGIAADCDTLRRRFTQFEARQRQFAAVLAAHAIPVTFEYWNESTTA